MADELTQFLTDFVDKRVALAVEPLRARLAALEAGGVPPPVEPDPPVPPPPPSEERPNPRALRMGMNLSQPAYYQPSWPFVDLMRLSHVNGSGIADYSWLGTQGLALDSDGWPLEVREGQWVETGLAKMGGHYPAGEYTLSWEGQGRIVLTGDATGTFGTSPVKVRVNPTATGINLKITLSSAQAPVRNVKMLMPGFDDSTIFHPLFIENLSPYTVLRFLDWGRVNRSPVTLWSERTRPSHRSQVKGVCFELMAALCNAANADAWLCIPHLVSQSFVAEMAMLFKRLLKPPLKVYLEYSNEVWNGGFSQTQWVEALSPTENVRQTYARKAIECFKTWEGAWGSRDRLVRVLSGQSANADVLRQSLLVAGPNACDAIASAPYFGHSLGRDAAVGTWPLDRVIQECHESLAQVADQMRAHKALADQYGVAHIAYEGGQHLAAVGALTEDAALVAKLLAANRDPRMEQVYLAYLQHWRSSGSGLFMHFNDVYAPTKWGSWGALEYQSQSPTPKSKALLAANAAWRSG